jgi:SAM-dependent methyltransferase
VFTLNKFFDRWIKTPDREQLFAALELWLDGERGQRLLAKQRELLVASLAQCFGYHLLQLSIDSRVALYESSRVQHKHVCHPFNNQAGTIADYHQLPYDTESLDVVLLHHVLEFADNPHQLLREVQRIVVPHGRLLLIGFNPWSPLGAFARVAKFLPNSIWHNQQISAGRAKDWLNLLGFEVEQTVYAQHMPAVLEAIDNPLVQRLLPNFPLGNFYLMSAVKEVAAMTPIKPLWKQTNRSFVGLRPAKHGASSSKIHSQSAVTTVDQNPNEDIA